MSSHDDDSTTPSSMATLEPPPTTEPSSSSSSSTPFNPCNVLITPAEIHRILSRYGVIDRVEDCTLFYTSMVHRSYCTRKNENFVSGNLACPKGCLPLQEESNERLELLGDAVLNMVVAEYLFARFPTENEGFLTRLRSKIVNGQTLSSLSATLGISRHVIVSRQIEENEGRSNKKVLEDCFEAFVGAMYLSLGSYEKTRTWIVGFLEDNLNVTELVLTQNNHKDTLSKYFQHNFNCQPRFDDENSAGSGGRARFHVLVRDRGGVVVGTGVGPSRKLAEEEASKSALRYFGVQVYD